MKKIWHFLKFKIKYLFLSYGYSIQKKSEKNLIIKKINLMEDLNKKKSLLKKIIKKFPEESIFQLMLSDCSIDLVDDEFIKNLNLYNEKRLKEKNFGLLQKLNVEIIPKLIFMGAFGNTLQLKTLLEANKYGLREKKKLILIWNKKYKINNKILFDYFKDFFEIYEDENLDDDFDTLSQKLEEPLRICMNLKDKTLILPHASNYVETYKLKNNLDNTPFMKLKENHKKEGEKKLIEMGVPKNTWFVTLHVREPEPNYRGETINNSEENFRNANPENYIGAIKEIISKGGYVLRMGSSGISKLQNITGLIDYANSNYKSELMDVYLGATSKFCIANSSGYQTIPNCFSVPRLLTDVPNHAVYFFLNQKEMYLPRLFLDLKTNKKIKFEKYFSYPMNMMGNDKVYKNKNLVPLHNTKEEITLATKEMIDKVIFKKNISNINIYQNKIKEIIQDCAYSQAGIKLEALADISSSFLEKNKELF